MKEQKKQAHAAMMELLFLKYRNQMYNIAFSILHNEGQAEDAVIEAFIKMIPYMGQCADAESKKTRVLLVCCIKHAAIDIYRKNRRQSDLTRLEDLDWVEDSFHPIELYHQMTEYQEQIELLREELPPHYWDVLRRRYLMEQSVAEIAKDCNLDTENIYTRIRRAKKKARDILGKRPEKGEAV